MKKRILSFALACMMVISTFIISKPLATIHAVENDVPTYTLPDVLSPVVDSNGTPDAKGNLAVNGNWSARVYDSMTTRAALPNTGGYALNTDSRWTFRVGGRSFGAFDSNTGSDAKVCVNPDIGAVPVIVFTAPEDGVYYFDEDVYHNVFVTSKKPIAVDFVVYKGDYAYANLFSAGPAAVEDDLTGYVALKAGEELLFAAERVFYETSLSGLTTEDGTLSGAYINDIVVKKVGELPENYADEVYYADFYENGLSTGAITEGQFTLAGYDYSTMTPVALTNQPTQNGTKYEYYPNGIKYWLGRSDSYGTATYYGATVIFKAPKAGYYALSIDANQSFVNYSTKNFWAAEISKSNGKILGRSETYLSSGSGVNNAPANLPTAGADFLEEGEEVYIVIKAPGTVGHFCAFRSVAAVYLGEDTVPTDDSVSYVLPMDWNTTGTFDDNGWELAIKGEWQLTTFADPTDITTIRNGASKAPIAQGNAINTSSPQSFIETIHNRSSITGANESSWTEWCVSPFWRWDQNPKPFKYGDNRSYMHVNPGRPINTEPFSSAAVVFTAPEDGTYSYSELVSQVMFEKSGVSVAVTAAVRKNGVLVDVFMPTTSRSSKTLEGTVSLKKGDLLMFTFTLNTEAVLEKEDNVLRLGTTEVKRVGDYAEEEPAVGTKYELPMDWSTGLTKDENGWDLSQKGNWRLAGAFFNAGHPTRFVDIPSNISIEEATDTYDIGPAPWIESADNHFNATGTENYSNWVVNGLRRDMSGTLFKYGDNGSFFRLSPRNQEAYACARFPSVIFTAPETGLYSYSTLVSAASFVDSTGADVEGMVSIRKNGDIIDSFVPTLADAEAILTGTVALKKDEVLMITFHCYKYGDLKSYTHTFNIGDTSITKISSGSGAEVDYSPIFDGTSLTDISGNVKLWGYDTDTKKLYDTSAKGDVEMVIDGTTWYAYDPQGANNWLGGGPTRNFLWHGLVNGPITGVGGNLRTANIGFALVFTAPHDGVFTVNAQLGADYNKHNSSYHDFSIMLEDGTVLKSSDNVGQPDGYVVGLFATAELKKGEKIIVLKTPSAESTNYNVSASGTASISIKEVNHVCSANTVKHVGAVGADCEDGNVEYYACACGLNYSDANATELLDDVTVPGAGHDTGDYLADQGKHWKHCETCGEDVEVKAHSWNKGVCDVCDYACQHEWNGDNVCDNCGYDRTVELAVNAYNAAIDNYFFGGTNEINPVGPTVSLDRFKVALPSGSVTGLAYKLFNLRFDNGEVFLRHHFEVKGDIALYDFTLDGEKVNPVYAGADIYYFETKVALGKLHVPGVIAVSKGNESVEFSVSAYSYLAVALEQSGDADVVNTLKALYDANEAIYTKSGDRALLEVTVESADIEKYVSDRTYDPAKEDITIILVMGQSNFEHTAGYAWEYGFYYHQGKNPNPPEHPLIPEKGTVYSFYSVNTTLDQFAQEDFVLDDSADMHYLANPSRGSNCISGTPAAFGTRWHELTGTKVVFLQVAEGSTSIDEWVPNPEDYTCGCNKHGTTYRYSKAVAAYTNAYAALSKNYNVVLSGYIWNQGEGDEWETYTGTVRDDQTYYDAYKSMHESLVSELDLDFGGISVVRSKLSGSTAEGSASYTIARVGQYRLCNELDDLYMLSTVSETCSHDMLDGSIVHYSQKVHNIMGVEMADNLYSALGYGTANAFDGIKIISKNGVTITHIDENGELALGTNILTAENTAGRVIIKNSALGREDTVSYTVTINGVDCSQYINAFGLIDWAALEAETGFNSLKVVLNVK